ncbi:MAG: response regulator transcription factor [Oscillospiraceae bacterium]|nr:response regulator transcription factor [Oscillospiraceae bacterium]
MTRILLVEDSGAIVLSLTDFLRGEGFSVTAVPGQAAAEAALARNETDLLLVDLRLADGRGQDVCAAAREQDLPVIILTAADDEASVVSCLDMGADDYITKPFRPRELVSRIRSVLRRRGGAPAAVRLGGVLLDTERGVASRNGAPLSLSPLEYQLLTMFAANRGKLLTRARILEEIWDLAGDFVNDNTLTVYIKRLRDKIEDDPSDPKIIKTVRGLGYRVD